MMADASGTGLSMGTPLPKEFLETKVQENPHSRKVFLKLASADGRSRIRGVRRGGLSALFILAVGSAVVFSLTLCLRGLSRRSLALPLQRRVLASGSSGDSGEDNLRVPECEVEEQKTEQHGALEEAAGSSEVMLGREGLHHSAPSEGVQQGALLRIFREQAPSAPEPAFTVPRLPHPSLVSLGPQFPLSSNVAGEVLPAECTNLTPQELWRRILILQTREKQLSSTVLMLNEMVKQQRDLLRVQETRIHVLEVALRLLLPLIPKSSDPGASGAALTRETVMNLIVGRQEMPMQIQPGSGPLSSKRPLGDASLEEKARKKQRVEALVSSLSARPSTEEASVSSLPTQESFPGVSGISNNLNVVRERLLMRMQRAAQPKPEEPEPSTSGASSEKPSRVPVPPPSVIRTDSMVYAKLSRDWVALLVKAKDPNFGTLMHLTQALWDLRSFFMEPLPEPVILPNQVRLTRLAAVLRLLQCMHTMRLVGFASQIDLHIAHYIPGIRETAIRYPPYSDPWRRTIHWELGRLLLQLFSRLPGNVIDGHKCDFVTKSPKVESRLLAVVAILRSLEPLNWAVYVEELPDDFSWISSFFPEGQHPPPPLAGRRFQRRRRTEAGDSEAPPERGDDATAAALSVGIQLPRLPHIETIQPAPSEQVENPLSEESVAHFSDSQPSAQISTLEHSPAFSPSGSSSSDVIIVVDDDDDAQETGGQKEAGPASSASVSSGAVEERPESKTEDSSMPPASGDSRVAGSPLQRLAGDSSFHTQATSGFSNGSFSKDE